MSLSKSAVFLFTQGISVIFNVALALLKVRTKPHIVTGHQYTEERSVSSVTLFVLYFLYLCSLQTSKDDLLQADFEGALKFFRVPVPKRYRSEENAKKLMELACSMKVWMSNQAENILLRTLITPGMQEGGRWCTKGAAVPPGFIV